MHLHALELGRFTRPHASFGIKEKVPGFTSLLFRSLSHFHRTTVHPVRFDRRASHAPQFEAFIGLLSHLYIAAVRVLDYDGKVETSTVSSNR